MHQFMYVVATEDAVFLFQHCNDIMVCNGYVDKGPLWLDVVGFFFYLAVSFALKQK